MTIPHLRSHRGRVVYLALGVILVACNPHQAANTNLDEPEQEVVLLPTCRCPEFSFAEEPEQTPGDIHRLAVVADLHVDSLNEIVKQHYRFDSAPPEAQVDSDKLRDGGVDLQFFAIWVRPTSRDPLGDARRQIGALQSAVLAADSKLVRVDTFEDILNAIDHGQTGVLLGLEGGISLEDDPEQLRSFRQEGVRYMSLTWNETNAFGTGAGASGSGGATDQGIRLVSLMNELGVLPDVSHASYDTFWDVVTASRRPVIASHSNAWALVPVKRNLDDLQLWAIAESGGVVGLNFHSPFLKDSAGPASLDDVLDHTEHMRAVIGAGHIAIGTDFDGGIVAPVELPDTAALPLLTEGLLGRGFSRQEVAMILGGNVMRVLRETDQGIARNRVSHRPAPIVEVRSSEGSSEAGRAVDRTITSVWTFPNATGETPASLEMTVRGPGVDQVAIWGSAPARPSGIERVRVLGECTSTDVVQKDEVELPNAVQPVTVPLPALRECATVQLQILVDSFNPMRGEPQIAEVVPERQSVRPESSSRRRR